MTGTTERCRSGTREPETIQDQTGAQETAKSRRDRVWYDRMMQETMHNHQRQPKAAKRLWKSALRAALNSQMM